MFNKDPRKKIFKNATALFEYFKFMYGSTALKYPILESSDEEEKRIVLEKLNGLIKDFKNVATSYLNEEITLVQLENFTDIYRERYNKLTYSYPALEGISKSNNYSKGKGFAGSPNTMLTGIDLFNILNP